MVVVVGVQGSMSRASKNGGRSDRVLKDLI